MSAERVQWGKTVFTTNGAGKTGLPYIKYWGWIPSSQWMEGLSWRGKTIKLLEKVVGINLWWPWIGQQFLTYDTKRTNSKRKPRLVWPIKIKNLKKIKDYCASKDIIKRVKRQIMEWEKIFADHLSVKELVSAYIKKFSNSTITTKSVIQKIAWRTLSDISSKKTYKWPRSTWKAAQHHQSLGKCQSKPQWDTTSYSWCLKTLEPPMLLQGM